VLLSRGIAAGMFTPVPSSGAKPPLPLYIGTTVPLSSFYTNYDLNVTGKVASKFQEKRRTTKHALNRVLVHEMK
jgi:hypothetical protein